MQRMGSMRNEMLQTRLDDAAAPQMMLRTAICHAFREARETVQRVGTFVPFCVTCTAEGFDITEHPGSNPAEVYASLDRHLAGTDSLGYALAYDGSIAYQDGDRAALVCEAALSCGVAPRMFAQPYAIGPSGYVFQDVIEVGFHLDWRCGQAASAEGPVSASNA